HLDRHLRRVDAGQPARTNRGDGHATLPARTWTATAARLRENRAGSRRARSAVRPRRRAIGRTARLERSHARLERLDLLARALQHVDLPVEFLARDEIEPREAALQERLHVL